MASAVGHISGAHFNPAGLAIGFTITLDIYIGGVYTGAAMNPARAFGPDLVQNVWSDAWSGGSARWSAERSPHCSTSTCTCGRSRRSRSARPRRGSRSRGRATPQRRSETRYVPAVLLLALSTGQKVGLGLAVAGFAGFSLIVSMVVPRYRPEFPGRGLRVFLVTCLLLFVGMISAVIFIARETSEAEAGGEETTAAETTSTTTQTATTQTTTTTQEAEKVGVSETEFKIALDTKSVSAGRVTFDVENDGNIPHDLVVEGNGVEEKTPVFDAGQSKTLTVDLKPGTYDLYCSVPGHKEAGMDLKLTVS
jgi:uncharacterized cupredoxin-like copper-binding protein